MSDEAAQLDLIKALLREESTLSLATADEHGEASVAPLFYIIDNLSLFWHSAETSLHSENLKRTDRAAAAIYRHTENWNEIRGVQMRGLVTAITERTRRDALIVAYCERFKLGTVFKEAIDRCILYEFRPYFFRYIDNSRHFGYKFEIMLETCSS
jgi:uncharacterized protein YhbP (UPF0306 family)